MKTTERTVHFYDLSVITKSRDKEVTVPALTTAYEYFCALSSLIVRGYEFGSKDVVEVADVSFDIPVGEFILLLNKADPEASDASYKDKRTRVRRAGNKKNTEDVEKSCHVYIKASKIDSVAEMKMTGGSGITPQKVMSMLNGLYKESSSAYAIEKLKTRNFPLPSLDENGMQRTYQVTHRVEQVSHPNRMLQDYLANGVVKGVEVIEYTGYKLDSAVSADVSRKSIEIKAIPLKVDIPLLQRIVGICKKNHQIDGDKIRVKIEPQSGMSDGDCDRTFDVDGLDKAFTKSEKIKLTLPHNDCQTSLSAEIVDKIRAIK